MTCNRTIPPGSEGLIRLILLVLAFFWILSAQAQSCVISGKISHADTTQITVYSKGKLILTKVELGEMYSLILGDHPKYDIEFKTDGIVKDLTLFTYGMNHEIIDRPVDFNINSSVSIYKEKGGIFNKNSSIVHRYYGQKGYRYKF